MNSANHKETDDTHHNWIDEAELMGIKAHTQKEQRRSGNKTGTGRNSHTHEVAVNLGRHYIETGQTEAAANCKEQRDKPTDIAIINQDKLMGKNARGNTEGHKIAE